MSSSVETSCGKTVIFLFGEEQLHNAGVNTAEARKSLSKVSQLRSEIQSMLNFEKENKKVVAVTVSGVTKITENLCSGVRSGIKASMATYFNLADNDVSVSDATASSASHLSLMFQCQLQPAQQAHLSRTL